MTISRLSHQPSFNALPGRRDWPTEVDASAGGIDDALLRRSSRLCFAALLSVTLLLLAELVGPYMPVWLALLTVPTSLSGGAFILSGLLLGLLLAACAVTCLTGLFYFAFWAYAQTLRKLAAGQRS